MLDDPAIEIRRVTDAKHGTRYLAKGRTASGRRLKIFMNPSHDRRVLVLHNRLGGQVTKKVNGLNKEFDELWEKGEKVKVKKAAPPRGCPCFP